MSKTNSSKDTYCKFPFSQLAIKDFQDGKLQDAWPCCNMGNLNYGETRSLEIENVDKLTPEEIFYHLRMEKLRKNLSNGVRDAACEVCWRMEDDGITSHRQHSLSGHETPVYDPSLEIIDITTSNICNLKCRMCNPGASNLLMEDHNFFKQNNLLDEFYAVAGERWGSSYAKVTQKSIQWDWLFNNMDKITILKASGGEPFLDKHILELLKKCVDKGIAKDISLMFHTNGTQFNKQIMQLLKHFHNHHTLSVDGTGSTYEYIRYPAKFSDINKNLNYYISYMNDSRSEVDFNFVVSSMNLFNIADFISWVNKINARCFVSFTEVYPINRGTSIRHLPKYLLEISKQQIEELLTDVNSHMKISDIIQQIDHAILFNQENKDKMKRELELFDKSRNQDYRDFLDPLLVDWLDE